MEIKYSASEAAISAKEFLEEVDKLQKRFGFKFGTDESIYLTYNSKEADTIWGHVSLGFDGDGSGIKVVEYDFYRKQALSKLTPEEIELLGLKKIK